MLTEAQKRELDRRGVESIKLLLINPGASGYGRGASVKLCATKEIVTEGLTDPLRGDVEDWILEKETQKLITEENKFKWVKATFWVALAGLIVALLQLSLNR